MTRYIFQGLPAIAKHILFLKHKNIKKLDKSAGINFFLAHKY